MPSLLIHAPNIHQGGGRTLLLPLLYDLPSGSACILDARLLLPTPLADGVVICRIAPSIKARAKEMWQLPQLAAAYDRVLVFGNLPPIRKLRPKTLLFLQNRYLIDAVALTDFPVGVRLRITVERVWLRLFKDHADCMIVQTASMQACLQKNLAKASTVMPFLPVFTISKKRKQAIDFLYIASGEPHKNHRNLIKAWVLLAQQQICLSLHLTLNPHYFADLLDWIMQQKKTHGLDIVNHGDLPTDGVNDLYAESRALIYPSWFESFGLPLLEAKAAGLSIVAAEEDYVRDVVRPDQTFNAHSPVSIARAVRRFLACEEEHQPIMDGKTFLNRLSAL